MDSKTYEAKTEKVSEEVKAELAQLVRTIAALRHPKTGCPWDLEQTHATLRRYMVEEAYEAAAHMDGNVDDAALCDELGDVLLQVVLNAQLASDRGAFTMTDVIRTIDAKMIRRHPHVFAPESVSDHSVTGVKKNWQEIKQREKAKEPAGTQPHSIFAETEKIGPATTQAYKIGKIASQINFDWGTVPEVFAQLKQEVAEFEQELLRKPFDKAKAYHELGDLFFTLAQLARHLGVDAELAAMDGNRKFLKRFQQLELLAHERGVDVKTAPQGKLEELWQEVKGKETK